MSHYLSSRLVGRSATRVSWSGDEFPRYLRRLADAEGVAVTLADPAGGTVTPASAGQSAPSSTVTSAIVDMPGTTWTSFAGRPSVAATCTAESCWPCVG